MKRVVCFISPSICLHFILNFQVIDEHETLNIGFYIMTYSFIAGTIRIHDIYSNYFVCNFFYFVRIKKKYFIVFVRYSF